MNDYEKLIKTFEEIGIEYRAQDHQFESVYIEKGTKIISLKEIPYFSDFYFNKEGKFIKISFGE